MDILKAGLDICHVFEWKGNLMDSTVCYTGETGDIDPNYSAWLTETWVDPCIKAMLVSDITAEADSETPVVRVLVRIAVSSTGWTFSNK